jgi:hypothetical protein
MKSPNLEPTMLNIVTNPPSTKDHHDSARLAVTIGGFVLLAVILFLLCRYFPPLQA